MRWLYRKKSMAASFTVEASIIVPIVTFVVFLLIYFGFFLHDRVKVQTKLHSLAAEGAQLIEYGVSNEGSVEEFDRNVLYFYISNKEIEKKVLIQWIEEAFLKGLFIGKVRNITISTDINELTIRGILSFDLPLNGLFKFFSIDAFSIPIIIETSIFPREELTRILDVGLTTGENVKGVSKAIDKLVEVINKIE